MVDNIMTDHLGNVVVTLYICDVDGQAKAGVVARGPRIVLGMVSQAAMYFQKTVIFKCCIGGAILYHRYCSAFTLMRESDRDK